MDSRLGALGLILTKWFLTVMSFGVAFNEFSTAAAAPHGVGIGRWVSAGVAAFGSGVAFLLLSPTRMTLRRRRRWSDPY